MPEGSFGSPQRVMMSEPQAMGAQLSQGFEASSRHMDTNTKGPAKGRQSSTPEVIPGAALPWLELGRVGGYFGLSTMRRLPAP